VKEARKQEENTWTIVCPTTSRCSCSDKRSRKLRDIYIASGSSASLKITHQSETGSIISY